MYPYHIILADLNTSTIPFITPPSPASHETISPSKDPSLHQSIHFRVVGSPGPTSTTVSRPLHLRHSRSSRVRFTMGFSMPATKQQLMWQRNGTLADWLTWRMMSRMLHFIAFNFLPFMSRDCEILHMM